MEHLESHPQSPSAKFAKFRQGLIDHANRTAAERAATDRKEHDATEYHRAAETKGQ